MASKEERVLEALASWLRTAPGRLRCPASAKLLRAIRFPRISAGYLAAEVRGLLPELPQVLLMAQEALVLQASSAAAGPPPSNLGLQPPAASLLAPRQWAPRLACLAFRAWV